MLNCMAGSMDALIMTVGILATMALLSCLCCVYMKMSDLKKKRDILELAKRKGIKIDPKELDERHTCQSPQSTDICTILIPDVAIIL